MNSRIRLAHQEAVMYCGWRGKKSYQLYVEHSFIKRLLSLFWYVQMFLSEFVNQPRQSIGDQKRQSSTKRPKGFTPPIDATFLFYLFMTPPNCDALVGDLEERYKLIHKKFGHRRANFWYWTQTVTSLGPIAWGWSKKVVMKPAIAFAGWAVAKGLLGHDSWLAAVMELWKKVRS